MINFEYDSIGIIIEYMPNGGSTWIEKKFDDDENIVISKTFFFTKDDLVIKNEKDDIFGDYIYFRFATLEDGYYKIDGKKLGEKHNLFFSKDIKLNKKMFVAQRNVSIFRKVFKLVNQDIFIGGEKADLEQSVLQELIAKFPNTYEIDLYVQSRIDLILSEYIEYKNSSRYKYDTYMSKKGSVRHNNSDLRFIESNELEKFELLYTKLKKMLDDEITYTEKEWQREILEVVLYLYPKYLKVFEEVPFKDVYSSKTRRLDFMLIDASGFVDIIEIKKPNDISILSKGLYRDNHVPLRELSGTIMQLEKYIFYLNKWGIKGETTLTERFQKELPEDINIKIVNPSGIVIMGRSNKLTENEISDFEVVKRKYKNIVEILTYDDLLFRLENIIFKWKSNK